MTTYSHQYICIMTTYSHHYICIMTTYTPSLHMHYDYIHPITRYALWLRMLHHYMYLPFYPLFNSFQDLRPACDFDYILLLQICKSVLMRRRWSSPPKFFWNKEQGSRARPVTMFNVLKFWFVVVVIITTTKWVWTPKTDWFSNNCTKAKWLGNYFTNVTTTF